MESLDNNYKEVHWNSKKTPKKGDISNCKCIIFHDKFKNKLVKDSIPNGVEIIIFGKHNGQQITEGILPSTIKILNMGGYYNSALLPNTYPEGLEILILGYNFNRRIMKGVLPNTLVKLELGENFEHQLTDDNGNWILPASLQKVKIKGNIHIKKEMFKNFSGKLPYIKFGSGKTYHKALHQNFNFKILPLPIANEIIFHIEPLSIE